MLPGEVGAASVLRLVPARAATLWERLTALLPDPADLVAVGQR
ncbi:hypothetical protein [Actinacidiphila yeochonensis]|nr:hypothetical protein [Actinacidiphila yeochonensis]